ncbi:MAG: hypothetical protein ACM3UX_00265, partial [Candidatus Woesearchaeota archaeon]
ARPAPARPLRRPARETRPPRVPPPSPVRDRSRRGPALALAGLVVAAVIAAIVIASSGGSPQSSQTTAGKTGTHASRGSRGGPSTSNGAGSSVTSQGSGAAASSSGTAQSGTAGSPVSAVESFYHLAAAHQYSSAWVLADPSFRSQLGGYSSFQSGQAGDRSITFNSAHVTSQTPSNATVYVRTTSVRDNGTQHCYGPVNLVRGSSGWLLDHIDINCA